MHRNISKILLWRLSIWPAFFLNYFKIPRLELQCLCALANSLNGNDSIINDVRFTNYFVDSDSVRVEMSNRGPIKDEKINRFFQDSGTEILGSMEDRDYVRWIWCKSSNTKELQQSKYLRHPFCHLIEENPHSLNKIRVNVDSDQMNREAVGECFRL